MISSSQGSTRRFHAENLEEQQSSLLQQMQNHDHLLAIQQQSTDCSQMSEKQDPAISMLIQSMQQMKNQMKQVKETMLQMFKYLKNFELKKNSMQKQDHEQIEAFPIYNYQIQMEPQKQPANSNPQIKGQTWQKSEIQNNRRFQILLLSNKRITQQKIKRVLSLLSGDIDVLTKLKILNIYIMLNVKHDIKKHEDEKLILVLINNKLLSHVNFLSYETHQYALNASLDQLNMWNQRISEIWSASTELDLTLSVVFIQRELGWTGNYCADQQLILNQVTLFILKNYFQQGRNYLSLIELILIVKQMIVNKGLSQKIQSLNVLPQVMSLANEIYQNYMDTGN